MSNAAEIETIYRLAMDDSGGPEQWAGLCPSKATQEDVRRDASARPGWDGYTSGLRPGAAWVGARPDC